MLRPLRQIKTPKNTQPIAPGPLAALTVRRWGVSSIQFMGNRSHGLGIQFATIIDDKNDVRWEHYELKQQRGMSEWLIAVNGDGAIKNAQAMICAPSQNSANSCRWP